MANVMHEAIHLPPAVIDKPNHCLTLFQFQISISVAALSPALCACLLIKVRSNINRFNGIKLSAQRALKCHRSCLCLIAAFMLFIVRLCPIWRFDLLFLIGPSRSTTTRIITSPQTSNTSLSLPFVPNTERACCFALL